MGHLFRALNLIETLKKQDPARRYILLVNDDERAVGILKEREITYDIYSANGFPADISPDKVREFIDKYHITCWYNDRLDTTLESVRPVVDAGIPLYTVDDMGLGAALAEGNFASLIFEDTDRIPGKRVYAGSDYLVLNDSIRKYRRERSSLDRMLVTLGGSDTYGVTLKVIEYLKSRTSHLPAVTVLLGPGSVIYEEARELLKDTVMELVSYVPSMPEFMAGFDLAITGGGVTPFEANAAGLPCIVIANEIHEIQIGKYLERQGGSLFAGYYKEMNLGVLDKVIQYDDSEIASGRHQKDDSENISGYHKITNDIISDMSRMAMAAITLNGAENILRIIN